VTTGKIPLQYYVEKFGLTRYAVNKIVENTAEIEKDAAFPSTEMSATGTLLIFSCTHFGLKLTVSFDRFAA
jgi:hypothetical protein